MSNTAAMIVKSTRPKMKLKINFLFIGSCASQTIGIGVRINMTLEEMLKTIWTIEKMW